MADREGEEMRGLIHMLDRGNFLVILAENNVDTAGKIVCR
jgi:hypothetical protein